MSQRRSITLFACAGAALALAACQQPAAPPKVAVEESQPAPAAPTAGSAFFKTYDAKMRTDEVKLVLPANAGFESEREYMVEMPAGQALVYSWSTEGAAPDGFYYELHGQDPANPDKVLAAFEKKMGSSDSGVFTVPAAGHYGWFFQNQSEKPVTVTLRIAGFYAPVAAAKS